MHRANIIPEANRYAQLLTTHITRQRGAAFRPFDGVMTLPRQLEIHLSNDLGKRCNINCIHCQGQHLQQVITPFYDKVSSLVAKLKGRIPLFVLSGAYSEPALNEKLIDLLELIKSTGSSFGLHTNGTLLRGLERKNGFLTRLHAAAGSEDDYMTVAIDACSPESFEKTKRRSGRLYDEVITGLRELYRIRTQTPKETLKTRITYLLNDYNSDPTELQKFVELMRSVEVDSVRFAVPYAPYGTPLAQCLEHKEEVELPFYEKYWHAIAPLLSKVPGQRTHVFVMTPEKQDVEKIDFYHCYYGYYMINLGADGFFYRCSAVAHPGFKSHRLGPVTDDLNEFYAMILKNQQEGFDPMKCCLPFGARCNRASIEINRQFDDEYYPDKEV
ncbi:MAG: radical SAM protein [Candidatus Saganbacteria bacterium]|nr:radical SAM protein [Candidatus Saganbacteria bacterium]